ncbi:MAG: hydrogenase maturation protease [Spirochaetes bacterium]|nr:MAG: hydrogenase maturation protease [Spirochaetota bacterium]
MDFTGEITRLLGEKTCIVAVGNSIRRDDGVGLYLADEIEKSVHGADIVHAEDIIESYVFEIADRDCENVLILDAVQTSSLPGSLVFGSMDEMGSLMNNYSTHKLSLTLACKIWRERGKKAFLLGIEAADVDFGVGLTQTVKKSADAIKDIIIETLHSTRKEYVYEQ